MLCYVISPNSIALQAYYATVVEDRPILSAEYRLPLLAKTAPLQFGLSALAELLLSFIIIVYYAEAAENILVRFAICYSISKPTRLR